MKLVLGFMSSCVSSSCEAVVGPMSFAETTRRIVPTKLKERTRPEGT